MKARAFRYVRAQTLQDALEAYAGADGECCYLAGGQSLVPSLSLRLQAPDILIDISRIEALRGVAHEGDVLRIGALTRHADILASPEIARHAPLLALAAPYVAHPAIRNKGTIGGTVALADPAAEFPAMLLALDAEFEIAGRDGTRRAKADGFFHGLYETGLEPGEILIAIRVPCADAHERCAFDEFVRRRGDYAIVGAGVQARFDGDVIVKAGIGFLSAGPTALRARHAEAALTGRALSAQTIADAQNALGGDLHPDEDSETSPRMRIHLARVLLGRLLGRLAATDRRVA